MHTKLCWCMHLYKQINMRMRACVHKSKWSVCVWERESLLQRRAIIVMLDQYLSDMCYSDVKRRVCYQYQSKDSTSFQQSINHMTKIFLLSFLPSFLSFFLSFSFNDINSQCIDFSFLALLCSNLHRNLFHVSFFYLFILRLSSLKKQMK